MVDNLGPNKKFESTIDFNDTSEDYSSSSTEEANEEHAKLKIIRKFSLRCQEISDCQS
jgi:hypothetical protein